jgi:PAS domain S-box-containing protein
VRDEDKAKEQLIDDLVGLRQQIAGLETERKRMKAALQERAHKLSERIKELNCLYGISNLVEKQGISLEEILQGTVDLIPQAWQYPEITCARIILDGQEFITENFTCCGTCWKQTGDIRVHGDRVGVLEVSYSGERSERHEGYLLKEEGDLLNAFAERLGKIIERKQAEEELKKFRTITDRAGYGAVMSDLEGNLTYINESFAQMHGYAAKELIGKHLSIFHAEEQMKNVEKLKKQLEQTGSYVAEEVWHKKKDGTVFLTLMNGTLIRDDEGKSLYLSATAIDITERRRMGEELKETNAFLRSILESSSSVSIISTDLEGNILYWNVGAENILGYKAKEVVSSRKIDILYDDEGETKKTIEAVRSMVLNNKKGVSCEVREVAKDGRKPWISLTLTPRLDENGQVIGILGIGEDITERKQAEEEVIHLYNAVNMATDSIVVSDLGTKIMDVNKATLKMYGTHDKGELIGRNSLDLIAPEDREKAIARMEEVLEKGYIKGEEYHIITKDGSRIPVEMSAALMKDADGKPIGFVAVSRDINERKRAENLVRTQRDLGLSLSTAVGLEEGLRLCVEAAIHVSEMDCGAVYLVDKTSGDLDLVFHRGLSPAFVRSVSHYDADSDNARLVMAGKPVYARRQELDALLDEVGRREQLRAIAVVPIRHEDRVIACLNISSHTLDEVPAFARSALETIAAQIGSAIAHLLAEEEVRVSEEKYRLVVENANEAIVVVQDGVLKFANSKSIEITGYSQEELTSRPFVEFIHPGDREMMVEHHLERLEGEGVPHVYPFRVIDKDGNTKWVEVNAVLITFMTDITERKHAEEALREYQNAVESSDDMIAAVDHHYVYLFVNQAFLRYHCLSRDQIVGHTAAEVMGEGPFQATIKPNVDRCLHGESVQYEMTRRYPEVGERRLQVSYYPLRDDGDDVTGVVAIIRDITEKRKMEEELLKAQKLESIGVLAGGIAHDFNNILTAILGNISLARMYGDPDKISEKLAEAERASIRAKDLTQQLLTFSRGGAPIKEAASIVELLKDSATFALSGSNVGCEFSIPDDLWPVEIDEGQMNQVINNLIINAKHAMPEGGIVRVRAENVTVGAKHALPLKDGECVKVSIDDHGIGIPKEHLQRIFDPYFTTKQEGSGLGLATAYSIVKNHDGHITAESQVGVGTTFHIYLPASPEKVVMKGEKEAKEKPIMGAGRVLVMDDEELVRDLVSDMLTNIGYKATAATDGTEAIELYRKSRESGYPFDAVILDLTIPGDMGGEEAVQRLREIDPEVKAIVSSGYSNDPIMADFRKYGFSDVIAKPYRTRELSQVLHRVMSDG